MNDFKYFINKYRGALIGIVLAIIFIALKIYEFIVSLLLIIAFAYFGNYIQQNKYSVKEKIKNFIDKI